MEDSTRRLGFGFMRLPLLDSEDQTSVDFDQLNRMVDRFLELGFSYFDTAYMYHGFSSEKALKKALVDRHPRNSFTVATKLPVMMLMGHADMERIFQEQLENCGVEYFDYYLLHNLNATTYPISRSLGAYDFVMRKKAEGKIRKLGFSFHDSAVMLDSILTEHPDVDFVQLQINYLDWDSPAIQSGACHRVAREHGKPIVVMEPVKGGSLVNLPERAGEILRQVQPDWSNASWALRFAASQEGVAMVLSGMSDMNQLEENTRFMANFTPLGESEYRAIDRAAAMMNAKIAVPCTACRYCVNDCPQNIAIPEYFSLLNSETVTGPRRFSIQKLYYGNLVKSGRGAASTCIECGRCAEHCPQKIDVVHHLKEVAAAFE